MIKAAGVADIEPIWATLFAKALEGKDVKDLLLNVGSGGGAAAPAAGAAGGAADAGAAADAPKAEEKEEGSFNTLMNLCLMASNANSLNREGRIRRRHGIRSIRLSVFRKLLLRIYIMAMARQDAICGMIKIPLTPKMLEMIGPGRAKAC